MNAINDHVLSIFCMCSTVSIMGICSSSSDVKVLYVLVWLLDLVFYSFTACHHSSQLVYVYYCILCVCACMCLCMRGTF